MIIELAGVSGVGKSTVMRTLIGVMRQNGITGMSLDRVARRSEMPEAEARERSARRHEALFDLIKDGPPGQLATLRTLTVSWERARAVIPPAPGTKVVAVVDEGFAHRLAYICAEISTPVFDAALALAPRADYLFVLEASANIADSRSIERRLPAAQPAAAAERAAAAARHLAVTDMLRHASQTVLATGGQASTIDATGRPRRTARAILNCLAPKA